MAQASLCPDNSSECLLRALYTETHRTNNKFSWDPITFAFTVGIGAIALWFAIVPILQGLFFPPERMKYGNMAIGPWSNMLQKRWDWRNLAFHVTIRTPVVQLSEIVGWIEKEYQDIKSASQISPIGSNQHDRPKTSQPSFLRRAMLQKSLKQKESGLPRFDSAAGSHGVMPSSRCEHDEDLPASSAGWLTLLNSLEITQLVLQKSKTKSSLATIIPTDIPAAVAYSDVDSVVTLAAIAGCKSISMEDKYPTCRGPGVQLDFRFHPSLGTVAAFSKYGLKSVYKNTTKADLVVAYAHGQGILQFSGKNYGHSYLSKKPIGGSAPPTMPYHSHDTFLDFYFGYWLFVSDIPATVRIFPASYLNVHRIASTCAALNPCWATESGQPDIHTSLGLIQVYLPVKCNTVFLQRKAEFKSYTDQSGSDVNIPTGIKSWLADAQQKPRWIQGSQDAYLGGFCGLQDYGNSFVTLLEARDAALLWLRDPCSFRQATTHDDRYRDAIILQLRELDYWLHKCEGSVVVKAASTLCRDDPNSLHVCRQFQDPEIVRDFPIKPDPESCRMNGTVREMHECFSRGDPDDWKDDGKLIQAACGRDRSLFWVGNKTMPRLIARYRKDYVMEDQESKTVSVESNETVQDRDNPADLVSIEIEGRIKAIMVECRGLSEPSPNEIQVERRVREFELGVKRIKIEKEEDELRRLQAARIAEQKQLEGSIGQMRLRRRQAEEAKWEERARDGLENCLIYRVVLFGALLDTGADNSCLIHEDIAKQIIPLL